MDIAPAHSGLPRLGLSDRADGAEGSGWENRQGPDLRKFRHWGVSAVGLWRSPNRRTGWAPLWNAHVRFSRTPVCMVDGRVHVDTFDRRRAATRAGKACERERMVASDVGVIAMEKFPLAACATWAAAGRATCDIRGLGKMTRYPAGKMAALGRAARTGPIDFPSRKLLGQPARITLGAFCDSRTGWASPLFPKLPWQVFGASRTGWASPWC